MVIMACRQVSGNQPVCSTHKKAWVARRSECRRSSVARIFISTDMLLKSLRAHSITEQSVHYQIQWGTLNQLHPNETHTACHLHKNLQCPVSMLPLRLSGKDRICECFSRSMYASSQWQSYFVWEVQIKIITLNVVMTHTWLASTDTVMRSTDG